MVLIKEMRNVLPFVADLDPWAQKQIAKFAGGMVQAADDQKSMTVEQRQYLQTIKVEKFLNRIAQRQATLLGIRSAQPSMDRGPHVPAPNNSRLKRRRVRIQCVFEILIGCSAS